MLDTTANAAITLPQQDVAHPHFAPTPSGSRHTGPQWFVVSTHPQAERRATHHLAQQGYTTFLPLYAARRRDRVVKTMFHTVETPLFPSYAFARFDARRDPWRPILSTPGVFDLIRNRCTGMPEPVRAGAVEALEASQDARRCLPAQNASWAPGTPCRPATGIMAGIPGVVLNVQRETATVSLMFLGHLREITLPLDCLTSRDE
jgi:transcription antitermination factor NusG